MSVPKLNYKPNKTTNYFSRINKIWSFAGLPNLWVDDEEQNKKPIHIYYHRMITLCLLIFVLSEIGSFFTQPNLTGKQSNDRLLFSFSHSVLFSYYISLEFHKERVKNLLAMLCITLKKVYNDPEVEVKMIKKASFSTIVFLLTCFVSVTSYGLDGVMNVIRSGGTFTTVVTMWPDVENNSLLASCTRVIAYLFWWIFMARVTAVITMLIVMTVVLSHQYMNLQRYFYSLNDLFKEDANEEDHKRNELKYLEALKVGIKLHWDTLWCTKQCQTTCSLVYSGQIMINICVLCLLMLQMVNSERTLGNTLSIIFTSIAVLGSSGFVMWNAGDITFEAALIPTAIYSSGWQHCRGSTSAKVRSLLIASMIQGQKEVVLRTFGIVEISYNSYLSIVKSSYSAFSLLY